MYNKRMVQTIFPKDRKFNAEMNDHRNFLVKQKPSDKKVHDLPDVDGLDVVAVLGKARADVQKKIRKTFDNDKFGTTFDTLRELGVPLDIVGQMKDLTEDVALAMSYILRSITPEDVAEMTAKDKLLSLSRFSFLFPKLGEPEKRTNNFITVKNYKEASVKDMEEALTEPK